MYDSPTEKDNKNYILVYLLFIYSFVKHKNVL